MANEGAPQFVTVRREVLAAAIYDALSLPYLAQFGVFFSSERDRAEAAQVIADHVVPRL